MNPEFLDEKKLGFKSLILRNPLFSNGMALLIPTLLFSPGTEGTAVILNTMRLQEFMIRKIEKPTVIKAAGNKPKRIEEFIGCVNSKTSEISIARMASPAGWEEPGQQPQFDEYTIVTSGMLRVKTKNDIVDVEAGQAIIVSAHEWVQYSTPNDGGAEYIAVCLPAFLPEIVNRDE